MPSLIEIQGVFITIDRGRFNHVPEKLKPLIAEITQDYQPEGYEPSLDNGLAHFLVNELGGRVVSEEDPVSLPDVIY